MLPRLACETRMLLQSKRFEKNSYRILIKEKDTFIIKEEEALNMQIHIHHSYAG